MIAFVIIIALGLLLLFASLYLSVSSRNLEKLSVYECGFDPYSDARLKFDIIYYLVAILFLIFDLELIFLFPFATVLHSLSFFTFWVFISFFLILSIGFIYELNSGSLSL